MALPDWITWRPIEPWDTPRISQDTINLLYGKRDPRPNENLERIKADLLAKCKKDPWFWMKNFVYTQDEDDPDRAFKPFPCYPFLFYIVVIWMTVRFLSVNKSRQMYMSWLFCALHLWACIYHPGRGIYFQSKKEDSAAELLNERTRFVFDQLPPFLSTELLDSPAKAAKAWRSRPSTFFGPKRSKIKSVPQGKDQMRGPTASYIFEDEAGIQEEFQEAYHFTRPALNTRGHMTCVCTPEPSFWEKLHHDEIEQKHQDSDDPEVGKVYVLISRLNRQSLTVRKNRNGFVAVDLHWSAHPLRDEAWASMTRATMEEWAWRKEFDLDRQARAGTVIFDSFDESVHVLGGEHTLDGLMLSWYEGIDFGVRNPTTCVRVAVDDNNTRYAYEEYYQPLRGIADHAQAILAQRGDREPVRTTGDPSMGRLTDNALTTVFQEFSANGLNISPADNSMERGIEAVSLGLIAALARHSWKTGTIHTYFRAKGISSLDQLKMPAGHREHPNKPLWELPALYFHPRCVNLIREIKCWIWKPQAAMVLRNQPDKPIEQDDHAIDALRYVMVGNPRYEGGKRYSDLPEYRDMAYHIATELAAATIRDASRDNFEATEYFEDDAVERMAEAILEGHAAPYLTRTL